MKKYRVLTPILHNGLRYGLGATISLTPLEATSLSVHVSELPGQETASQKEPPKAEKPKQVVKDETPTGGLVVEGTALEGDQSTADEGAEKEVLETPLTNAQLSELLTQQGVEHNPRARKADLEALVAELDPDVVESFKASLQAPTDEASNTGESEEAEGGVTEGE